MNYGHPVGFDADEPDDLEAYAADVIEDAAEFLRRGDRDGFEDHLDAVRMVLREADEWRDANAESEAVAMAEARAERAHERGRW